jgi:cytochrome P450
MSPWPSVLHALKGDRHLWIDHCFKKYGMIDFSRLLEYRYQCDLGNKIRIEPNTVLFRSPTALHTIYGSKANVKRAKFYDALVRREEDRTTISTIDNAAHAKRRKLLNQAFTEKSLRAAAVFMERHIDRWNELLLSEGGEDWSAPLNFADWSDRLVFDILGDVAFGRSFQIKEPGENTIRGVPHAIVKTMRFLYPVRQCQLSLLPHFY